MTTQQAISARGVRKAYGDNVVLDGIDLDPRLPLLADRLAAMIERAMAAGDFPDEQLGPKP